MEQADIEQLESEIDEAVYDLFDPTPDEREVIEDYLEVFCNLERHREGPGRQTAQQTANAARN